VALHTSLARALFLNRTPNALRSGIWRDQNAGQAVTANAALTGRGAREKNA